MKTKIYKDMDGNKIERVSRWIKLRTLPITSKHHLYDYATDECGYHPYQEKFSSKTGVFLDYFIFEGKQYALEQFSSNWANAWNPYYSADDLDDYVILSGYEAENYFHPLLIELDECGEHVRMYREVRS